MEYENRKFLAQKEPGTVTFKLKEDRLCSGQVNIYFTDCHMFDEVEVIIQPITRKEKKIREIEKLLARYSILDSEKRVLAEELVSIFEK